MATAKAYKTRTHKIRDSFPAGFRVAYARMVIDFGRLEQQLQLAYKNLQR